MKRSSLGIWRADRQAYEYINLPFLIGKKFAIHGHDDAIPSRWGFFLHRECEINRRHDAITKFFLDHVLEGQSIHLQNFVEAIQQRIGRDLRIQPPLQGVSRQGLGHFGLQPQGIDQHRRLLL